MKPVVMQALAVRIAALACIQQKLLADFSIDQKGSRSGLAIHLHQRIMIGMPSAAA